MNKIIISLSVILLLASCKGPGSGPLVKDSFSKNDKSQAGSMENPHGMTAQSQGSKVAVEKIDVKVDACKDCIKISDLLENKNTYSGKTIKVTGKVTKFNPEIMGKNWIHLQDGSEFQGGFDLTITTGQKVAVGDIITFEGKIVLDKDFGYGYVYNVLMEDAKPVI
jgi:cell wall assembly regulator SMI1